MATNFPSSLDAAAQQPSPSATTDMDATGFEHHTVHTNHSGALIALETKMGIGASAATGASDGDVLTADGSGGSAWAAAGGGGLPTGLTFSDTAGLTVAPTNVGSNGLWTYASLVLKSQSSLGNTSGTHILFAGANGTTNVGIIGYDGSKSYRVNNMQSGDMYIATAGSKKVYLHSYLTIKETEAYPGGTSGTKDLGTSTALFQDMYSVGGVTTSSDVNIKEEISSENALGLSFINDLRPVQYKLKDGTRKHQGFIAQEVKTALDATDSSASDQGMWGLNTVNSPKTIIDVPNEDAPYADYTEEEIDTIPRQSLRYHEFIAPLVKAVQELTTRVAALEG